MREAEATNIRLSLGKQRSSQSAIYVQILFFEVRMGAAQNKKPGSKTRLLYIFYLLKVGGACESEHDSALPPHQIVDSFGHCVVPLHKDTAFLQQKYLVEKLSIREISALASSSKEAVRKSLLHAGVQLREQGKPHGRPSQPKFGKRLDTGREVEHKAEQKVVAVVRELRSQGLPLRQIAQTLSRLGVPTKCRGKGWHPEMVRRVLAVQGTATSATLATRDQNTRKDTLEGLEDDSRGAPAGHRPGLRTAVLQP